MEPLSKRETRLGTKLLERLTEFCERTGYPERQLRMFIWQRDENGIEDYHAVIKIGGRWHVNGARLMRWTLRRKKKN